MNGQLTGDFGRASHLDVRKQAGTMRRAVLCMAMALIASLVAGGPSTAATLSRAEPLLIAGCGAALPKPGGGLWECTFADEFNGTSLDRTKWLPQTNFGTGTSSAAFRSCHVDDPANVSVRYGLLQLTVRKASTPVACQGSPANYTSGQVSTYRKFSQQYGRFEARMKVHGTLGSKPGLQEAFWMWPDDRYSSGSWPAAGEMDVAELYSQYNTLVVPFLHYTANDNGGPKPGVNTAYCSAARGRFNTYTLTWTPTTLTILVNGSTCLVNTSGDPAFQKPYILAFSQALGVGANALRWNTPLPATMHVDYMRVWR
jgi:beta-glucanase (GH16 family)